MTNQGFGIATGDVVMLKSGGAAMTVAETDGSMSNCVWHDMEGRLQNATLGNFILQKVTDTSSFGRPWNYPSQGYA